MFTQAEIEYIQKQYARGLTSDAVTNKLIEAGWDKDDIVDGIKEVTRLTALSQSAETLKDTVIIPAKEVLPETSEKITEVNANSIIVENKATETINVSPAESVIAGVDVKPTDNVITGVNESVFPDVNNSSPAKKIIKIIIGIIVFLLVVGGLAFAYYQFFYKPNSLTSVSIIPTATSSSELIDQTASTTDVANQPPIDMGAQFPLIPSDATTGTTSNEVIPNNVSTTTSVTAAPPVLNNQINNNVVSASSAPKTVVSTSTTTSKK